ncbi:Phosphoribosylglycinamide synthetase, ATP-grasp (A) domain protein [Polaromonas sp. CG9_12]|nr:Phosphoribosylglycinamide synthetase, ATP-grasp (A) domain protein [Polaromonas sp. CG9_12]
MAYASDPAAPTAAYVAEQLGLPGNPYSSVLTLARKDLFRAFLKEHQFNVPAPNRSMTASKRVPG